MAFRKSIAKKINTGVCIIVSMMASCCFAQDTTSLSVKMLPDIPPELTDPPQRAEYLVLHFWDKFNFCDTTFMATDHLLERSFVDFIDLLSFVPDDLMEQSIQSLLKKSEDVHRIFTTILQLSEKYLYEPSSPLCDEEKLIPFMVFALHSSTLQDIEKIRPTFLLENSLKNRIGTVANDFTYTLINGEKGNLYTIEADYTLLYFNDPDCEDCRMLIKQLVASPVINQLIHSGQLKIITVYVNDDREAWEKHATDVLPSWIYSFDAEQVINDDNLYDIKHFPTMYLLDYEKKVMLKDTTFEKLTHFFTKH